MEALSFVSKKESFVSKKDRLEKPHHRAIRPRCGCRDGKIIQYPANRDEKSLGTLTCSSLYRRPIPAISARRHGCGAVALPARALEENR
jgi:hypothetical protein